MMYYQTKFGCKQTNTLKDIQRKQLYFDYISPHCDLDIEDNALFSLFFFLFFLHDTQAHDNTPTYQIWFKMVKWFRGYPADTTDRQTDRRGDSKMPVIITDSLSIFSSTSGLKTSFADFYHIKCIIQTLLTIGCTRINSPSGFF